MKKIIYLLLFTTWCTNAQIVNIPDANFKAGLIDLGVDTNFDGEIQESEALQLTSLDVTGVGIVDMTGIEAFINLVYLNCDINGITNLDLSQNINLVELHCWHNLLESLDLSQNINLVEVYCNGNHITNLNVSQNLNLEVLHCYGNYLPTLDVSQNLNLNYLDCSGNELTTIDVSQNTNLQTLKCNSNDLPNIDIALNSNLEIFECSSNPLNGLDLSQNENLDTLICFGSGLTTIDVSQNLDLREFRCNFNQLNSLDVTQNSNLEILVCNYNQLNTLDLTQNTNLISLDIWHNQFVNLDLTQNVNLEGLSFSENQLAGIDVSQNLNLKSLRGYLNQLSNLDISQNTQLVTLDCAYNQLTALDITQNINLEDLNCRNNQISDLDFSQSINLTDVNCLSNQLTSLDLSQSSGLEVLYCANNALLSLNIKNGSIEEYVNLSNNPDLSYICVDDAQFETIHSLAGDNVEVNSYCSFTSGGNFNTITGTSFFDEDNNGCDMNDLGQFNVRIDINDGTNEGATFTNALGDYTFYTDIGSFDLSPSIENSPWFNISPLVTTIPFTDDNNNIATQDYCLTTNGIHNDVEVMVIPLIQARPGFDVIYQIVYRNKGNQLMSGTIDFAFDDSILNFIFSSDSPNTQTTGNLTWNYNDLLPFESRSIEVTLNLNAPTETPAVNIGDVLYFTASISPLSVDEIPSDNSFDLTQTVVGSYDPNDITCLEGDIVNPEHIGEYLHYNINFENTGTAAATFVVVKDVIDENQFDINSLQVIFSSHSMMTRIINNKVEFIFDNINLQAEGKGNVVFKIKSKNTLVTGDAVNNKAEIFFDYNFPIETNTATTVFDVLSVNEFSVETINIYPNPSEDIVNVNAKHIINLIEIYDVQGRLIQLQQPNESNTVIQITSLKNGIYFFKIKTDIGESLEKIIKN